MSRLSQENFRSASEGAEIVFSFAPSLDDLSEKQREVRLRTLNACGIDTCHPDAHAGYKTATKTSKMLGSNYVAAILFTYMAVIQKRNNFYPIVVENSNLPNALSHYFMIFDNEKKKVFDFTPEIISGGFAIYRRDVQLAVLRSVVSDDTLLHRVEAGLINMNIDEDPQIAIQVFIDQFHVCFHGLNPAEAFIKQS